MCGRQRCGADFALAILVVSGRIDLGTLLPEPAPGTPVSFLSSAASEVIPHCGDRERSGRGRGLSYVGTLTVTVSADIDAFPDSEVLVDARQDELDALTQRQHMTQSLSQSAGEG